MPKLKKPRPYRWLPAGEVSFKEKYLAYKKSANRRGLEFSITFEEFKKLTSDICFYCGKDGRPYNKYLNKNGEYYTKTKEIDITKEAIDRSWINFNGLDRVDNNKGYTLENCVTCCWECNNIKSSSNQSDFLEHIKMITKHLKLVG